MLRRIIGPLAPVVFALVLAGCGAGQSGSSTSSGAGATTTETVSSVGTTGAAGASASASSSGNAVNVGDKALKIGQWREGAEIRTRVRSFTQSADVTLPSYLVGDSEAQGAIADVEMCARESVTAPITGTAHGHFVVFDGDGGRYQQASSSWDVWPPRPQFPTDLSLAGGQCSRGWILFSVPADTRITKISNGGADPATAEWLIK